jgi:translation initiation factor IF-3
VRVVTEEGEQLGIMNTRDAVKAASDRNLDLVEVAPAAKPPVCKIMDYGKFKYEQAKKDREARKKQHVVDLKEIRMSVKIGQGQSDHKVQRARDRASGTWAETSDQADQPS